MLVTTTNTLEGYTILSYQGIVNSEVIIGANVFKDFFASLTDFFGGRSTTYEKVLIEAKETAIKELIERANAVAANAVIGIDFDFETLGDRGSMLMVIATGTAVYVEKNDEIKDYV
jgi:uncharacterized protein YbjQ (UPF0145 family)